MNQKQHRISLKWLQQFRRGPLLFSDFFFCEFSKNCLLHEFQKICYGDKTCIFNLLQRSPPIVDSKGIMDIVY